MEKRDGEREDDNHEKQLPVVKQSRVADHQLHTTLVFRISLPSISPVLLHLQSPSYNNFVVSRCPRSALYQSDSLVSFHDEMRQAVNFSYCLV